jgi:hypothetical protein
VPIRVVPPLCLSPPVKGLEKEKKASVKDFDIEEFYQKKITILKYRSLKGS